MATVADVVGRDAAARIAARAAAPAEALMTCTGYRRDGKRRYPCALTLRLQLTGGEASCPNCGTILRWPKDGAR